MKTITKSSGKEMAAMIALFTFFSLSQFANAQERCSLEVRPGVNFATQNLGTANLETGFGAEGTFAYRIMPHLSAYAGWSWNKFSSDLSVAGTTLDFEETGYSYGVQFIHPFGNSKLSLLARAGGLYNHIEAEKGSDVISDSGHGFGWQVEGGLVVTLAKNWRFIPSVRYRALSRNITIETVNSSIDLNYLSVGGGVAYRL